MGRDRGLTGSTGAASPSFHAALHDTPLQVDALSEEASSSSCWSPPGEPTAALPEAGKAWQ